MKLRLLAALAASLALTAASPASKITLRNGTTIEARVVSEDRTALNVQRADGSMMRIPRNLVVSIEESAPGVLELQQAAEAVRRNELPRAQELLKEARAKGAPADQLAGVEASLEARARELDLMVHKEQLDAAAAAEARGDLQTAVNVLGSVHAALDADSAIKPELAERLVALHLQRARNFRDVVDDVSAIGALRAVTELDPSRIEPYMELAELYAKNSRTRTDAIAAYEKGLQLGGAKLAARQKADIHWRIGEIHRELLDWPMAFKNYVDAHRLDPMANPRLADRLVTTGERTVEIWSLNEPARAILGIDIILAVREIPDLLNIKGRLQVEQKDFDGGLETYRRLLAIDSRYPNANYNVAQLLFRRGDNTEGRRHLELELEVDPDSYEVLCQLGEFAADREEYDEAERRFTRAVEVEPELTRGLIGLAKVMRSKAQYAQGMELIEKVLEKEPGNFDATYEMGRLLRAQENFDRAAEAFTRTLDLLEGQEDRTSEEMRKRRADALIGRGEARLLTTGPATANSDFNAALTSIPDYPMAYYNIGQAYKAKFTLSVAKNVEDLAEAERNLAKAHEIEPANPTYVLALGILYHQALGPADPNNKAAHFANARRYFEEYIRMGGADANTVRQWIQDLGA
ncbi:MAG: tetratricopeptide repeat protein [Candidatus Sumerlaeia bacterium]|nr:tetratricopeptide repeat protein [Candidatus Sumerlaeia bacterium]